MTIALILSSIARLCSLSVASMRCWAARAQGADAVGDVVGEFDEKLDLVGVESILLGRDDAQHAKAVGFVGQRKHGRSIEATFERHRPPAHDTWVAADVMHHLRLAGAHCLTRRAAAKLVVGPREAERVQLPGVVPQ